MTSLLGTKMPSRTRDHIEACIESGERMTKHTVAATAHCHLVHAQYLLKQYRDAGFIRPVEWVKNGCQFLPVFSSQGKRKAQPKGMTATEKARRLRASGYNVHENMMARKRRAERGSKPMVKPLGLAVLAGA